MGRVKQCPLLPMLSVAAACPLRLMGCMAQCELAATLSGRRTENGQTTPLIVMGICSFRSRACDGNASQAQLSVPKPPELSDSFGVATIGG